MASLLLITVLLPRTGSLALFLSPRLMLPVRGRLRGDRAGDPGGQPGARLGVPDRQQYGTLNQVQDISILLDARRNSPPRTPWMGWAIRSPFTPSVPTRGRTCTITD